MDVASTTRSKYAAAWAVVLGPLPILAVGGIGAMVQVVPTGALFTLWIAFTALQLAVLLLLIALEYRNQRTYWAAPIPVSIVVAKVVAGLTAVLVGGASEKSEATYADVLF